MKKFLMFILILAFNVSVLVVTQSNEASAAVGATISECDWEMELPGPHPGCLGTRLCFMQENEQNCTIIFWPGDPIIIVT